VVVRRQRTLIMIHLVPDSIIDNFESLIRSYGVELNSLLHGIGVPREQLNKDYRQIDAQQFVDVMEYAAIFLNQRFLGLQFGERSTSSDLGNLWFLLKNSSNIKELANNLVENYAIFTSASYFSLEQDPRGTILLYEMSADLKGKHTQAIEAGLTSSCLDLRRYISPDWMPAAVYLKSKKPIDCSPLTKVFGDKLHFNQEINGILITSDELKLPVRDAKILDFHHYNYEMTLQSDFHQTSLATQTENIINTNLAKQKCTLEFVANCLNTKPRTLQHKLAKCGTSFKNILQKSQLSAAMRYLKDTNLSVTEISIRLQFAEVSVFTRFIKNNTGKTPKQHR